MIWENARLKSKRFSVTNFCDSGITAQAQVLISQTSCCFAETALRMMPPLFLPRTYISHRLWTYVQAVCWQHVLFVCAAFLTTVHASQCCQSWKHGLGGARSSACLFVVLQTDAGFPGCFNSKCSPSAYRETPFQWKTVPNVMIHTSSLVHSENPLEGYQTLKVCFFLFSFFFF